MRILIADDDITSRRMLSAVLERSGYELTVTVNGREAWEVLQEPDAPKLVILDWMMPEMDGIEVCRRVRALETDCPPYIIMLTSKGEIEHVIAGLGSGTDDYLIKPFQLAELHARIEVGRRTVALQERLNQKVRELQEALEHAKMLQGLLPICSFCKKIRNGQGNWQQLEIYIRNHSGAEFSHGICPVCLEKHYPGFGGEEHGGR
jgi:phosphoserine phosphatase RsbU/P